MTKEEKMYNALMAAAVATFLACAAVMLYLSATADARYAAARAAGYAEACAAEQTVGVDVELAAK